MHREIAEAGVFQAVLQDQRQDIVERHAERGRDLMRATQRERLNAALDIAELADVHARLATEILRAHARLLTQLADQLSCTTRFDLAPTPRFGTLHTLAVTFSWPVRPRFLQ